MTRTWVPWPTHEGRWWVCCTPPTECMVEAFLIGGELRVYDGSEWIEQAWMREGTRFTPLLEQPPEMP